jgi:hypothetical protein
MNNYITLAMSEPSGRDSGYKRARLDSETSNAAPVPFCLCEQLPQLKSIFSAEGVCTDHSVEVLPPYVSVVRENPPASFSGLTADEGFEVVRVYSVNNFALNAHFFMKANEISTKNHQTTKLLNTYHCVSNLESVIPIIMDGFRNGARGFFGTGIYTSESPFKANDYSPAKGNPNAFRVMLRCQVIEGNVKDYEIGSFDRDLTSAPPGFDSVSGIIRRAKETVVFDSYQVRVTELIIYRYRDTARETEMTTVLPTEAIGQIIYITASLSEFFTKIKNRCSEAQLAVCKKLIGDMLRRRLSVRQFLNEIRNLLKAEPPADLEARINVELSKCRLPDNTPIVPATPVAPNPAPAPSMPAPSMPAPSMPAPPMPAPSMPAPAAYAFAYGSAPPLRRSFGVGYGSLERQRRISEILMRPLYPSGTRVRFNVLAEVATASRNPAARTDATQDAARTLATLATINPSRPGATASEPVLISSEEDEQ